MHYEFKLVSSPTASSSASAQASQASGSPSPSPSASASGSPSPSSSPSSSSPPPPPTSAAPPPTSASGAWCTATASVYYAPDDENNVYVHSNQPYTDATASGGGYRWSYETDGSGYAVIYLNGPPAGTPITVTVGAAGRERHPGGDNDVLVSATTATPAQSRTSFSASLGTTKDARKIGKSLFPVHRKATISSSAASKV